MIEKYKEINAYIQKVEDSEKIIDKESEAFEKKGKWNNYFGNTNDIIVEIGTGLGNFFSGEVSKNNDKNFIGFEIRYKRLFVTAEKTLEKGGVNFVLIKSMAQNIDKIFEKNEVSLTYIFFPDPWDKKDRQRKHRLWTLEFISNLYDITKSGGSVIFKTDHKGYFDDTLELINKFSKWNIEKLSYDYEVEIENFDKKNLTEFESIFREHKMKINYLELKKLKT
ncbi:MAG: tRNA (guanosine(46)-N7)-methyltransferase TrmB [Candidatus Gracilibacteria bacterium]|nr:tRNA (guanosine(46)-N7)-methyltransferase TrmB [Candidatus Gracilibacteria bacterium]